MVDFSKRPPADNMDPSPADMLAELGRALYGEHWRLPLANGIAVNDDTIRRWMTGRVPFTAGHGALDDALAHARQRAAEITAAADRLETWIGAARKQGK